MKQIGKRGLLAFTGGFLLLCLLPSAGMLFAPAQEAVGNEHLSAMPVLRDAEGGWNRDYLSELSSYLADHIAFRHQLITLDSQINGVLFATLPNEDVLLGRDGWLYYTETLPDYQGVDLLTERECWAAARTLWLIEEYCRERGVAFLFTVAPNKNSLYPEAMPARYAPSGQPGNAARIADRLEEMGVPYLDLFSLLAEEDRVLYYRTDSHWNSLGAALAGDALCEALGKVDTPFFGGSYQMAASHRGDLYEMVYPAGTLLEENAVFDRPFTFSYPNGIRSAEDITIRTENPAQSGSLLMFRDSFGNDLYPFMAERFGAACFSRAMPYNLSYLEREGDDTLVVEIVERNLRWLVERPAVMPAPVREPTSGWPANGTAVAAAGTAAESSNLPGYIEVSGTVDCVAMDADSPIYLRTADGWVYEALSAGEGENPFTAYLPAGAADGGLELGILIEGTLTTCTLALE